MTSARPPGPRPTTRQIRRANALSAIDVQKQDYLISVCHDAQQPLTVILAQAQLLQRQIARGDLLSAEVLTTRLAYVFGAASRLRSMTQDLLDTCLQQSGSALILTLAPTDLVDLTRRAISEHELISEVHEFRFDTEVPTLVATVDELRLYRVLANLLTNAIKYSPTGGTVHVSLRPTDGPDGQSALFIVRDEGVGIPREDLPYVFDQFHRGANVIGRFAGTGTGLASARGLVELHGGTIAVDSQERLGTAFFVRLPLEPSPPPPPA